MHIKNDVSLVCSLLNMKRWLCHMGLFLSLFCIQLGLSCQKILPKVQAPKGHKKGKMGGCIEAELSTEGF